MATIDEVLAAMPEPEAEGAHEYLVIDPVTRTIFVPEAEAVLGVTGDDVADRKYFICPRYVGDGLDLAGMFIRVNYRNANGEEDSYLVDDVAVSGEYVTFSWRIWPKAVQYVGTTMFGVCADLPNTPDRHMPDWNTTLASAEVLEGLDPDLGDVEGDTSDVVTQLRAEVAAQTGNVQNVGAAQIQAVQDAAAESTADAQAQIEAKGTATLATIPADYSTMAGKVNEFANAIKGHLSGEILRADDVSPVEHYPAVRIHGKNLFDTSKIPTATPSVSYAYISEVGPDHIVVRTEEGYDGNGYCTVAKTLREVCPSLEVGKTYVLIASTESNSTNMYLPGIQKSWIFGRAMVMTEAVLNSAMTFYGLSAREGMGTGDCTISNIQIEEGNEATEYTPYIDPAAVTVCRYGKNMAPPLVGPLTVNGLTVTPESNGIFTISGAVTGADPHGILYITPLGADIRLKAGQAYTLKLYKDGELYANTVGTRVVYEDSGTIVWNTLGNIEEERILNYAYLFHGSLPAGDTSLCGKYQLQLEASNKATAFEPYQVPQEINAREDGTVGGLTSLAPTMTLQADTAGVVIECEYNRDTNAVLAEILDKIAALGG